MKRIGLFLLAVVMAAGAAGCGKAPSGSDTTSPTGETWAWENVQYSPSNDGLERISGTLRNVSEKSQYVGSVYCRLYNGDVYLGDGQQVLAVTLPAHSKNESLQFYVEIDTDGRWATRWEFSVIQ